MNADFLAQFESALAEVTDFLGSTFIYQGNTYTAVINETEFTANLITGGQLEGLATVIVVPKAYLPTAPAVGEKVKVEGKVLRVERVKTDEAAHELTCISAAT